jgi:hypothetical protein
VRGSNENQVMILWGLELWERVLRGLGDLMRRVFRIIGMIRVLRVASIIRINKLISFTSL